MVLLDNCYLWKRDDGEAMKSNKKEEQEQGDLLVFKEQFFDFFLYYLPEFSPKAEDRKEGEKTSKKMRS
ncbi:hypothetical protein [Paenibacillus terreus]